MEEELLKLISDSKINLTNAYLHLGSGDFGTHDLFEINPKDFLTFSKLDLKDSGKRGVVNALTNAKRAIDCQIDEVFKMLSIDIKSGKILNIESFLKYFPGQEDSFFRMRIIEALNLAPSLLVAQTREIRHKLEHYYIVPELVEVKRAQDVADLFIKSVKGAFRGFHTEFEICDSTEYENFDNKDPVICINYIPSKGIFTVGSSYGSKTNISVNCSSPIYYTLLRLMFTIEDPDELPESFRTLIKQINHKIPSSKVNLKNVFSL